MALIDLINEDVVKVPLESAVKEDVFRELIDLLHAAGKISDPEEIYDAIIAREQLFSTALENGIAIPHAKTKAVNTLTMALGISPDGIEAESQDGKPSHVFFLILAPPEQTGPHLEALSEIAGATKSGSFRRLLVTARSPEEIVELFQDG
jgi:nitrogen PTS system EIIA component